MSKTIKHERPVGVWSFIAWLKDQQPRPSKAGRKFTHHRERRAATREIREAL